MSEELSVSSLRARLLQAVDSAIARLHDEAHGRARFDCFEQMRACIVLAQLAPTVLSSSTRPKSVEPESELPELPPDLPREEAERLLRILEGDDQTDTNSNN
jgi:hypothetical protein